MDPKYPIKPTPSSWQIMQQTVAGQPQPALVKAGGRRYEWQHDVNTLNRLLECARGAESSAGFSKEILSKMNPSHLNYQRLNYSEGGILLGVVQRIIPTGTLPSEIQEVIKRFEATDYEQLSLTSAQSLHLQVKRNSPQASYAMYLSSSPSLMSDAQKLSRLLEHFASDWGLHPIFLPLSTAVEVEHLNNAIQGSDLFVALVNREYAAVGTRTQSELRTAQSLASIKSYPWMSAIFFENADTEVNRIFNQTPSLYLYGKSPKDSLERMASFALSLLIRKRAREQGK